MKEKCAQFNEIEKTNSILKQQLDSSFALNDKMIQKIGSLEQENDSLIDENWKLVDKLREESLKDDFSTTSSNKTIDSVVLGKNSPLSGSLRYSNTQQTNQYDLPQEKPETSTPPSSAGTGLGFNPSSNFTSGFASNFVSSYGMANPGFATERQAFNADVNVSRASKTKSIIGEGFDSKRILEPSSYFPSRESNYSSSGVYSSMIGQFTSRDSGYGLQRRERR
jgi:hypothetical protein